MHRMLAVVAIGLLAGPALAYTFEGVEYAPTLQVGGRTLKLVGVGMREVTVFHVDVYVLAAYVENRTCDPSRLVESDEVKVLRMRFVRDVGADKMRENMEKSFRKRTPPDAPADLKTRIRDFVGLFGIEAKEGMDVEVRYLPGQGTTVLVEGRQRGATVPGHDFIRVLWDIYFNPDTCCPSLRQGVLKSCREMK